MKKSILFLIVFAFAALSSQAKAQQVIASAGGYYEGENISLSWTLGEPVTETFSAGGVILTPGISATLQLLHPANPEYSGWLERCFKLYRPDEQRR
jgi:hypothetical protein